MKRVTLGGERLGSGNNMKVEIHGFEMSTQDLGYLWRSTMSAGTLVPFMKLVAQPGDVLDIHLAAEMMTHPTTGPLFGSEKVQLDIFQCPFRLYQAALHNNKLNVGLKMSNVKLPQMTLFVDPNLPVSAAEDPDNCQINPSALLAYLGIRGVGQVDPAETGLQERQVCALPLLSYFDVYKNYYSNKQEGIGSFIFTEATAINNSVTQIEIDGNIVGTDPVTITAPATILISYPGGTMPPEWQIIFRTSQGNKSLEEIGTFSNIGTGPDTSVYTWRYELTGNIQVYSWHTIFPNELPISTPKVQTFSLTSLDNMREYLLSQVLSSATPVNINDFPDTDSPYYKILNWDDTLTPNISPYLPTQQGLALKTYQSDLFNNWLKSELFDPTNPDSITALTTIDTTAGLTMDTLNITKKVYDMLQAIAVSGGTYNDWVETVYGINRFITAETPIYHGGLIKELVFQEVVSNSESNNGNGNQPLGTLAGKGVMSNKNKGGNITIHVHEHSYIIGIISITPRLDYSQGNDWDIHLQTMDDLHKPHLDQIGFQELTTEQLAWWDTEKTLAGEWTQRTAGKQPAWINYMTEVNRVRGNFAIQDNEMFMTLNRRYEFGAETATGFIQDLTTYIDPVKFNHIFADTSLDAQNYWAQIAVDIQARRKLSAKIMPNV